MARQSKNTKNTINLMAGAFLSADAQVTLVPLTEPLAVQLMSATGSKLTDKELKLVGNGSYYVAQLTTPSGEQCWANIPVEYPYLKWSGTTCWALLKPQSVTLSEAEFNAL